MSGQHSTEVSSKFSRFTIIKGSYKKVGCHELRVDVMIPRTSLEGKGKRPVIARFHGGYLVLGDSLFPDWFPNWILDLAYKHAAIIVSPNYRLIPEATGLEVLDDIEDFWQWLHSPAVTDLLSNQSQWSQPLELDLERIITAGESAGGLLSIQTALSHADQIRVCTASYPVVDIEDPFFSTAFEKNILGTPQVPESVITDHIAKLVPGSVVSSAVPPERIQLMFGFVQQGRLLEFIQRGAISEEDIKKLIPMRRIEDDDAKLPVGGLFINHGIQDTAVPVAGSKKFIAKIQAVMKGKQGADNVTLTLQDGEHGYDAQTTLDEGWVQDGLTSVVSAWLE
ncbi:Alpha/Beta hydrolase [Lipomyces kononenkoae]|uniref:Alpha/Beta hydrolase n=1 Tax=Lipomyces kononenkoae TaxID=34357 RepID=A0ACC3SYE9_LIPKO